MLLSAGDLYQLVRRGEASTRLELAQRTGLSRTAITSRVEALLNAELIVETAAAESTGGRPPTRFTIEGVRGIVMAADFGATHCRLAVSGLSGVILAERAADIDIALGPDVVLSWMAEQFLDLLDETGHPTTAVRGIGMGLPGPVEFAAGRAMTPPIMPGWDGVDVPALVSERFPVPVLVDNDVNIMAMGEYQESWRDRAEDIVFVKVGTGVGCGVISRGEIHRGSQGAAGDIGHIQVESETLGGHAAILCHCGNRGCVEAIVGGAALCNQLTELGYECRSTRDVVRLAKSGNGDATRIIREGGRALGQVLAGIVNFYNPAALVFGGDLVAAQPFLLAGIREVLYQRSTPLATRDLELTVAQLGDRAGIVGAASAVLERILAAEAVDVALADRQADARVAIS